MESNAQVATPLSNQGKQGKGLVIATVVLSVVAICGIGFGTFEFYQSLQKESENKDLLAKLSSMEEAKEEASPEETEYATHFSGYMYENANDNKSVNFYTFDGQNCAFNQAGACSMVIDAQSAELVTQYQCETSSCAIRAWGNNKGTEIARDYAVILEGIRPDQGSFDYAVVFDVKNKEIVYRGDQGEILEINEYGNLALRQNGEPITLPRPDSHR